MIAIHKPGKLLFQCYLKYLLRNSDVSKIGMYIYYIHYSKYIQLQKIVNVVFDIDMLIFEAISIYLLDTELLTFMKNMFVSFKKLNFEVCLSKFNN